MDFLAVAAPILSIGSSLIGAAGQIKQGQAAAGAASYNAKVAAQNAQIATQNAGFAGAEGEANVGQSSAQTRAQSGATLANEGASGVNINSPSFQGIRTSEAEIGKLNAMTIRSNAARQAYGYQTQTTQFQNQAALDRAQQSYDKQAGFINAGATVLGGVGQAGVYSKFLASTDPTTGLTANAPSTMGPNQTQLPWQEPGWG